MALVLVIFSQRIIFKRLGLLELWEERGEKYSTYALLFMMLFCCILGVLQP